jgi:hypothetical protein
MLRFLYEKDAKDKHHSTPFLQKMVAYVETWWVDTRRFRGVVLSSSSTEKHYWILEKGRLVAAQPEDIRDIQQKREEEKTRFTEPPLHKVVGFVGYENNNQYLVFKLKQTDMKRNTGARCDEAVKAKKVQFLNQIFDQDIFVEKTLTAEEKQRGLISTKGLVQAELCSFMELLLRYYQRIHKDGKTWFLDY